MLSPFLWYTVIGICLGLMGRIAQDCVVGNALREAGMRPVLVRLFRTDLSDLILYRTLCEREGKSLGWWRFFTVYYVLMGIWLLGILIWLGVRLWN